VVILPGVERIPLETLQRLAEFAHNGGVLIATRRLPSLAPGFLANDADNKKINELAHSLFEGSSAVGHFIADEKDLAVGEIFYGNALFDDDFAVFDHFAIERRQRRTERILEKKFCRRR